LTVSAGIAVRSDISHTIEEVIVHADTALYMAKANGRDRVEVFVPATH
jgi:PleD family two-component response regulator